MPALVVRGPPALLDGQHDLARRAEDDLLQRVGEVGHLHLAVPAPGGGQRRLVDQVAQVGADHPGRGRGQRGQVDVGPERHPPGVHLEDLAPALLVRRADRDPAVEPARPQQGRVEHVRPVGRGQHDHALGAGEAVHLGEDLVERLLPLVDAADAAAAAGAADRVQLVDEDDRRGGLLRRLEQVAHPGRADADDELDELGRRQVEERHVGLAGHRAGQQRLAGARRAGEQHALRDGRAERGVLAGVAQEVDDLGELVLHLVDAGDVGERGPRTLLRLVPLGPRSADPAEAAEPAAGRRHPPEEPDAAGR